MEDKPKRTFIAALRKTLFIAFVIMLGVVMLGALGSMVLTVFLRMEHPKADKQEQSTDNPR